MYVTPDVISDVVFNISTDINNVGAISQALFANGNPDYDEVAAAQWQATQVSTVSITNCLGRIVLGMCTWSLWARCR